jgi:hypothetical protein
MKTSDHRYIRFLALCHAFDKTDGLQVDVESVRLLESIALAEHDGMPLTVSQLMALSDIASPATLHRKMVLLNKANLIELDFMQGNQRTKFIYTTALAKKHFAKRAALLAKAVSGT